MQIWFCIKLGIPYFGTTRMKHDETLKLLFGWKDVQKLCLKYKYLDFTLSFHSSINDPYELDFLFFATLCGLK